VKELSAAAAADTDATLQRCFELVSAIDRYPSWYPATVTAAEVTKRDDAGLPSRAHVDLHIAHGVLVRDFHLDVEVQTRPLESVAMSRIPRGPEDHERLSVAWTLTGGERTRIEVRMHANLSIPRFVPVGGVAESFAGGFLEAALGTLA
jgi:ribosome-associated toxin RatA of RatAB toxin-antitoxin module